MLIRSLGDYAAWTEGRAFYPEAGTHSAQARAHTRLGVNIAIVGDVSESYRAVALEDGSPFTIERLALLKAGFANVLWSIVRCASEHEPDNAESVLWDMSLCVGPDTMMNNDFAAKWLQVSAIAAQTNFSHAPSVAGLIYAMERAAFRHGWTLKDLADTSIDSLEEHLVLTGTGDPR